MPKEQEEKLHGI